MKRGGSLLAMTVSVFALAVAAAATPKFKILHTFTGAKDGGLAASAPALDSAGNVYGTTSWGGTGIGCAYGCGVVFELTPQASGAWNEIVLLDFDRSTGVSAYYAPLLFDANGGLFGSTTSIGGGANVFQLTPGSNRWNFNPIYDAGGYCLMFDSMGNLYGCIEPGGIGELSPGPNGWNYTDLNDSCSSLAQLSWDGHGNLYGTERYGGNGPPKCPSSGGCGEAFRVTPEGNGNWTCHVLHRFANFKNDGYYPYAGLTIDASGNAYGATWAGGKYDNGTFFKLTPSERGQWRETILYEFPNCNDGCGPATTLVFDKAGNLYGSAAGGNTTCGGSCGVIYKLALQKNGAWKYMVVHKFNSTDGAFPCEVVLDGNGNIFGTTMEGGKYGYGVVFEISP